ncbi:hypothetical protein CFI10_07060 [Marinobacterium iners]|uniref:phage tail protein n=1 Tax=Marinobacterium iners TaxID=48076 RepID=UPI001A909515|nr:phage tail protein [Marinobacterium iners]QSR34756.1 hypothetical protein CFI10_07060 [Marinobacterium iners]
MGGSSSVTVGYKYYLGAHMVLCHGPIDKIVKIDVGGKEAWIGEATANTAASARVTIDKPKLFGGDKREGGIQGDIDVLSGHPDQAKNDYLLAKIGSAVMSAYRGVTSVVLRQCYLGVNPYLKPWKFTAQRIHVRGDGSEQWYPEKAEVGSYSFSQAAPAYVDPLTSLDGFDVSYGSMSSFVIQDGHLTNTPDSGATSGIVKSIGPFQSYLGFKIQFRVNFLGQDDAGGFSSGPIGMQSSRQPSVDPQKRVQINGAQNQLGVMLLDGPPDIGVWYEIEAFVNPDGLDQTVILRREGVEVDRNESVPFQTSSAVSAIGFTQENLFPGGSTTWRNLEIWATNSGSQGDMNPAHIIRECLTDSIWGRGLPESEIGPSFATAADQLHAEGLGLSFLWTDEAPIEDLIGEVLRHIDAVRYEDPETGLQELKLIRGDYDIPSLPVLDHSNSEVTKFEVPALSELTNQVTVKYWNRETDNDAAITVQDTAAITMVGTVINQTYEYPGITNDMVAGMVATRDLMATSRPFARGTVVTNRTVANLKPGDVFVLNDPDNGIDAMVCRVAKRSDSGALNGEITIEFGEDVFGSEFSAFTTPTASGWAPIVGSAANFPYQTAFEVPYVHLVRRVGDSYIGDVAADIGYVGFIGAEPENTNHLNYDLFVYPDGTTLPTETTSAVEGDFGFAAVTAAGADPDASTVSIAAYAGLTVVPAGEFVLIGTGADGSREIAALAADLTPGDTSISLHRGVADTIPRLITATTPIFLFHKDYSYSSREFVTGEVAEVYGRPSTGQSDFTGPYTYHDIEITNRVNLPYPPANVKLNDTYVFSGDPLMPSKIVLTWSHRDRGLQSNLPVSWFDAGHYGPEAGVSYRVEVDLLDASKAVLQAKFIDRLVGPASTETLDFSIDVPDADTEFLEVRVYSARDGLDCLQPFTATVALLKAPADLTAANITVGYGTNYGGAYGG